MKRVVQSPAAAQVRHVRGELPYLIACFQAHGIQAEGLAQKWKLRGQRPRPYGSSAGGGGGGGGCYTQQSLSSSMATASARAAGGGSSGDGYGADGVRPGTGSRGGLQSPLGLGIAFDGSGIPMEGPWGQPRVSRVHGSMVAAAAAGGVRSSSGCGGGGGLGSPRGRSSSLGGAQRTGRMVSIVQQQRQQQLKQSGKQVKDIGRGSIGLEVGGVKDQAGLGVLTSVYGNKSRDASAGGSKGGAATTSSSGSNGTGRMTVEAAAGATIKSWPSFEAAGNAGGRRTGGGGSGVASSTVVALLKSSGGSSTGTGGGGGKLLEWAATGSCIAHGLAEDGAKLAATLAAGVTLRQQGEMGWVCGKVLGAGGEAVEEEGQQEQQQRGQWEEEVDTEVLCLVCDVEKKIIVTGGNDASIRVSKSVT